MFIKKQNLLDEMQEKKLLKIESMGFWLAFWLLFISIFAQMFIYKDFKYYAGEWTIFMILCLYTLVRCLKNGIWERKLKPNFKTNFLISILSSVGFGVIFSIFIYMKAKNLTDAMIFGFIIFLFMLIATNILLAVILKIYKKREYKLENEEEK